MRKNAFYSNGKKKKGKAGLVFFLTALCLQWTAKVKVIVFLIRDFFSTKITMATPKKIKWEKLKENKNKTKSQIAPRFMFSSFDCFLFFLFFVSLT